MVTALAPYVHRWTRAEYDQIAESGALDGTHAELLNGCIVEVDVTRSPAHDNTIHLVNMALQHHAGLDRVQVQRALAASDDSEPEPDVLVLASTPAFDEHPRTALLVVEVAVSSQDVDLGVKRDIYARAGIPAYWVVEPLAGLVHVHTAPVEGRYLVVDVISHGGTLQPFAVPADEVLPPRA